MPGVRRRLAGAALLTKRLEGSPQTKVLPPYHAIFPAQRIHYSIPERGLRIWRRGSEASVWKWHVIFPPVSLSKPIHMVMDPEIRKSGVPGHKGHFYPICYSVSFLQTAKETQKSYLLYPLPYSHSASPKSSDANVSEDWHILTSLVLKPTEHS